MSNKVLSTCNPLISCYPQHAFYMSIISEKEECLPWIYSNYSNLFIDEAGFCDFIIKTPEYHLYPWFQGSQRLHKNIIIKYKMDFIQFIKESIDDNNYIVLDVDEFYLPCSQRYQKKHFIHHTMICGYDDETLDFLIYGFYNQQKYSLRYVEYKDLEKAFLHSISAIDSRYIHLITYNENYSLNNFRYNINLFKDQLYYHYNSIFAPALNPEVSFNLNSAENLSTGLEIYNKLIEFYSMDFNNDHRPIYTLYEHKKFMNLKLRYLKENKYFIFSEKVYQGYEKLEIKTQSLLFLYIKYNVTKNSEIPQRCIEALSRIRDDERELLGIALNEMN
ncbi:hypothetical protein GCM10010912_59890 [Paenibacillus albidus]|uniref:Butirosin biosynthesis protein H N-terminal domain-containing protein n=1 Tax=Paenibacillus albidus TaxID=2041023 RepID=A0A917D0L8_9BACL|nr:hypothetical protein [Paenibacillus albidus]GGG07255.1 hypothetical protein GCM10010912_59890 [Paenibacillus albidus]